MNRLTAALREQQGEATNLDAATCLPKLHRRQVAANEEDSSLRSQTATIEPGRGRHRKYLPYAFTEHGAIMAASVLNSPKAIEMSVLVELRLSVAVGAKA